MMSLPTMLDVNLPRFDVTIDQISGHFQVGIGLFTDNTFTTAITEEPQFTVPEMIHVGLLLEGNPPDRFHLQMKQCWATPRFYKYLFYYFLILNLVPMQLMPFRIILSMNIVAMRTKLPFGNRLKYFQMEFQKMLDLQLSRSHLSMITNHLYICIVMCVSVTHRMKYAHQNAMPENDDHQKMIM